MQITDMTYHMSGTRPTWADCVSCQWGRDQDRNEATAETLCI